MPLTQEMLMALYHTAPFMKNILILYSQFDGKNVTGGQIYEENMYQCMLANPDVNIERYGINRKKTIFHKILSPFYNLRFLSKCRKNNIVIFNSSKHWHFIPLSFIISHFTRTKVLIIHHHFMNLEYRGMKRCVFRLLETIFLHCANHIITVSPYIYELCNKQFKSKDVRLWPIPFSQDFKDRSSDDSNNILYIGTVEPRKGLIYLFKSLAILKNNGISYHLNIIGKIKNQEYFEMLDSFAKEKNLHVTFHGYLSLEEKDSLISQSKIFVFPSLLEGYGMVLKEVMFYGLPIVCFDNSAMPYLVKDGINGIVVENKNYEEMADAISSILINPELRKKLSNGSYQTAKNTISYREYENLISEELESI